MAWQWSAGTKRRRTMNRIETSGRGGEARVRYLDGDFQIVTPGAFVRCAVTGQEIPLDELRYWNVERQEAYADAAASLSRHIETRRE
jgi:hypothetical protein